MFNCRHGMLILIPPSLVNETTKEILSKSLESNKISRISLILVYLFQESMETAVTSLTSIVMTIQSFLSRQIIITKTILVLYHEHKKKWLRRRWRGKSLGSLDSKRGSRQRETTSSLIEKHTSRQSLILTRVTSRQAMSQRPRWTKRKFNQTESDERKIVQKNPSKNTRVKSTNEVINRII